MKNMNTKGISPLKTQGFNERASSFANNATPVQADIMQTARHRARYILISPNQSIDTMCHIHAAKRIVVLDGCACVMLDGCASQVLEGATLRIPAGIEHSITNAGKIPLAVLELRTGPYLGDDDRLDDRPSLN
jgi:mannose-6-phosphate isomerase-like protein (cupin superfamily)